jgi:signal transduction histidine kinase
LRIDTANRREVTPVHSFDQTSDDDLGADEQAALRRVAQLVARGATTKTLFSSLAEEVARLVGADTVTLERLESDATSSTLASVDDPTRHVGGRYAVEESSLLARILRQNQPVRIEAPPRSAVGVAIVVDGQVWGAICVGSSRDRLPADTERRLARFSELVAAWIATGQARSDLQRLLDEQAALKRVATLVARDVSPAELFSGVAHEVAKVLQIRRVTLNRFELDDTSFVLASINYPGFPTGSRWPLDAPGLGVQVSRTGLPARVDDFPSLSGPIAAAARNSGVQASVGVPIIVNAKVWGMICVAATVEEPLPSDTESRLAEFAGLLETAVANGHASANLRRLADEQAALRRLAMLVVGGASGDALFSAVAQEVAQVFAVPIATVSRYDLDRAHTVIASLGRHELAVGTRLPVGSESLASTIFQTGRPARIPRVLVPRGLPATGADDDVSDGVGAPIVVDDQIWGLITVEARSPQLLPADTGPRLGAFAELVGTAVSNMQARSRLRALAEEQTALRRVATLVARRTERQALFNAVCDEAGRLIAARTVSMVRLTADGFEETVAAWTTRGVTMLLGSRPRTELRSMSATIRRTLAPARFDEITDARSELGIEAAEDIRSVVGAPVVVDGRLWGLLVVSGGGELPLAPETEQSLARFAELVAAAVANAAARAELLASRVRIVSAADEARRKIERNLHDGAQQRLIALGLDLQGVRSLLLPEQEDVRRGLDQVSRDVEAVLGEVQELSRGLHPALLARGGLATALRGLVRRSPIPVSLSVATATRPTESIEIAIYYAISEALTNVAKHSRASQVTVSIEAEGAVLRSTISDDGIGGAVVGEGSGLVGLVDRVEALGGRITVESPPGSGTTIVIELPLAVLAERPAAG